MEELTLPFLGRERCDLQYPFGDLVRSGARLAGGSDWGVTTADPLVEIEVMVNRVDPADRGAAPFLPEQRVSLPDALRAFTLGTAYVNHDEQEAGSLQVGKRADLAVLDHDVVAAGEGRTSDATVVATMVAGEVVFDRL
jgi:predicted amidohydrolase YtcJ